MKKNLKTIKNLRFWGYSKQRKRGCDLSATLDISIHGIKEINILDYKFINCICMYKLFHTNDWSCSFAPQKLRSIFYWIRCVLWLWSNGDSWVSKCPIYLLEDKIWTQVSFIYVDWNFIYQEINPLQLKAKANFCVKFHINYKID